MTFRLSDLRIIEPSDYRAATVTVRCSGRADSRNACREGGEGTSDRSRLCSLWASLPVCRAGLVGKFRRRSETGSRPRAEAPTDLFSILFLEVFDDEMRVVALQVMGNYWQKIYARDLDRVCDFAFLRATAVPAGTASTRISYRDSVRPSVRL